MKSILALLFCLAALCLNAAPSPKPNFIIILVDDMGFSDLGCYGGEIPTPNIDALAAGGLCFTQFYNTGRCCPTRAALLTGLYPHQAGIGHLTDDDGVPGYRGFLNDRCVTLGEVLRGAGYFTAHTGKCHVGHGDEARLPLQRGFDRFYGVPEGGVATPLIAHWPAGINHRAGEWRTQPGHVMDIMPTLVELAGAAYPAECKGQAIQPMEGRSLVPSFSASQPEPRRIFWEHEGHAAVRDGDWKLVRAGAKGTWELYDLAADRTEMNDLAEEQPERVKSLTAAWEEWARRVGVEAPRKRAARNQRQQQSP
jgi:arylsulfatase A-like enzyme